MKLCWQTAVFRGKMFETQSLSCFLSLFNHLWQVRGDSRRRRSLRSAQPIPQGSISLPSSLTQNLSLEQQQLVSRVQFNFYQTGAVYQVCSLSNARPECASPFAARLSCNPDIPFLTTLQDKNMGKRRLNSGILGASVTNISITGLQDGVIIRLRNTELIPVNANKLKITMPHRPTKKKI